MTRAARISSAGSSESVRARRVEEAVHSVRMEGLDFAPADAADAAEYVSGGIDLEEYGRRTRARYGVPEESGRGSGERGRQGVAAAARPAARAGSSFVQRGR